MCAWCASPAACALAIHADLSAFPRALAPELSPERLRVSVCLAGLLVFAIALPGLRIAARLGCGKEVESRALRPGLELTVKTGREN